MRVPSAPFVGNMDHTSTPRRQDVWALGTLEKKLHGHSEADLSGEEHYAQKKALDEELADAHEDGARSRSFTSPRPMRAAFTDRSMRLRDTRPASWVPSELEQDASTSSDHKDCSCASYEPSCMHPAGISTSVINTRTQFLDRPHWDTEGNMRHRGAVREQADSHSGGSVRKAIHCRDDDIESRPEVHQERELLDRTIGRKGRGCLGPSSQARATSADGAAGAHRTRPIDAIGFSKIRQGKPQAAHVRSDIAMIVAPNHAEDPAPPRHITSCVKAFPDGTPSLECERLSVKHNEHLHRFDMPSETSFNLGRRPPSVSRETHGRNPVTHEGCAEKVRSCTPMRQATSNRSHGVEQITNHEKMQEHFAAERELRLSADTKFAGLCSHTQEHLARQEKP
jgi:hypothetical protein